MRTRNRKSFAVLSLVGLAACAEPEPAATPLNPPPPDSVAAPAPVAVESKQEELKAVALSPEQSAQFYQDGWASFNAKDFAKFQLIWSDDASSEMLDEGDRAVGPSAIVDRTAKGFVSAFPDGSGEVELTLINGKDIVGVVLMRGTQTGAYVTPMGPVPPTGKRVGFFAAHHIELNDQGKALKEVMAYDRGTVAGQLGLTTIRHRKAIESGWTEKPVVIASGSQVEKANLAAFNERVDSFNKHDAAGALSTAADNLVFAAMSAPADRVGKKQAILGLQEMYKVFPDAKLDVKSAWGAGDYVFATGFWSGTPTVDSPAMKLQRGGQSLAVQFVEIDQLVRGKTTHIWLFTNGAAVPE